KISKKIFTGSRSNIMMEYKGYFGKVEFDDEANIFYGEVICVHSLNLLKWNEPLLRIWNIISP
ncbi:MAG: hypothetical protein ABIJ31_13205, partial [Pseudomonadota bacterium]